jgi:hypothetical protein
MDFLERWDSRRWEAWRVPAHELGHSMLCIEPLHVFLDASDRDDIGLFSETHATYMGNMGLATIFGRRARDQGFMCEFEPMLDWFKGATPPDAINPKLHLLYLTWLLERELGDEFCRRYVRLGLADPPDLRNRIRAQPWTPAEKICALYSAAAGRDLSDRFREYGLDVRPGTDMLLQ